MRVDLQKTFRAISIAILVGVCAASAFAQATTAEGVQFFNAHDGKGMVQEIPVGVFNVNGKQLGADASVKVSKEYFVRFCSEKDGGGKCEEFGEGTHNLSSTDFASIKVWKGAATPQSSSTAQVPASGATPRTCRWRCPRSIRRRACDLPLPSSIPSTVQPMSWRLQ